MTVPPIPAPVAAALRRLPSPVCAYVYDIGVFAARAAALRAALPSGTRLLYAMKANGHPDLLSAAVTHTDGIEVASGGELAAARAAGARRVAFAGPGKTDAELAAAVSAARDGLALTVNVESRLELRRLGHAAALWVRLSREPAGRDAPVPVPVALRVNRAGAAVPAGSHRMTGVPTPFGVDEHDLGAVAAAALASPGLDVVGFHLHAVSNTLDAAGFAAYATEALGWARAAADRYGIALREVNIGGGLGLDYAGDREFDLAALRAGLARPDPHGPDPHGLGPGGPGAGGAAAPGGRAGGPALVVEPGRWLAGPAGWYAAEVVDLKRTHGRWFAVLRGGTHHFRLPAAWGYSHPFAVLPMPAWPYPWARPEVTGAEVDAVGELCTPRDVLTRGQVVDRLRVGDILVFAGAGAYGWEISHDRFLRHPPPATVVIPAASTG